MKNIKAVKIEDASDIKKQVDKIYNMIEVLNSIREDKKHRADADFIIKGLEELKTYISNN